MNDPNRRRFLHSLAALPLALLAGCQRRGRSAVGFSQIDSNGAWRIAETNSLRHAVEQSGRWDFISTDAQDQTAKQISDVEDLIARRVVALCIAPRDFAGLEPAFDAATHAGVPVFLVDRVAEGTPGADYVSFIGSDFVLQGQRAGRWLAERMNGRAKVLELSGTPSSSVARDRADGFREAIAAYPEMRIVASQTGQFARSVAHSVTTNILQTGLQLDAIYAHNDEMALGAIEAARGAGLVPGGKLTCVSIDGQRAALLSIIKGELGATVESNPRLGQAVVEAVAAYLDGREVPPRQVIPDRLFDATNAAEFLDDAY